MGILSGPVLGGLRKQRGTRRSKLVDIIDSLHIPPLPLVSYSYLRPYQNSAIFKNLKRIKTKRYFVVTLWNTVTNA